MIYFKMPVFLLLLASNRAFYGKCTDVTKCTYCSGSMPYLQIIGSEPMSIKQIVDPALQSIRSTKSAPGTFLPVPGVFF